jgi:hypothetical protein
MDWNGRDNIHLQAFAVVLLLRAMKLFPTDGYLFVDGYIQTALHVHVILLVIGI